MRERARHWSKTAFAMAVLFGAMAIGSRLWLGAWPFDGAEQLAWVCVAAGVYFRILARKRARALRDAALLFDEAFQLAAEGRADAGIRRLTAAIRENPQLWQAWQYRGELRLARGEFQDAATDFEEAMRLAPGEPHLAALHERATAQGGAV